MNLAQVLMASMSTASGSPAQGGTGSEGSVSYNGFTYYLTPRVNGLTNIGTANPGDNISFTVSTSPADAGRTLYIWVDGDAVPSSSWVQGTNNGTITLNNVGVGSFALDVVSHPPVHNLFKMYVGYSLYQGFLDCGYIGI